jgi:biopolymer transport protein ExbB
MDNAYYIFIEALNNTWVDGGPVMLPILITGCIGFYFVFAAWMRIGVDFFRNESPKSIQKMHEQLEADDVRGARNILRTTPGFVSKELQLALDKAEEAPQDLHGYLMERLLKSNRYLDKGTIIISVMAISAPLLGLLGTVTGMVATFNVITLYGNSNPVLMADGISEALITTQSGLLIAFPLTLLKQRLDDRIEMIKQQIELGSTIILHHSDSLKEGSHEL